MKLKVKNIPVEHLEQYAKDIVDGMDMDDLVDFAIHHCLQSLKRETNLEGLFTEMTEYYGEDWAKKINLQVFK